MPAFVLGNAIAAGMMRHTRSAMLQVLDSDYIRTARAKGLPERRVVLVHALRNALLPLVTLFGLSFPFLLFTSYCLALTFLLPAQGRGPGMVLRIDRATRTSIPVLGFTVLFFVLLDVVIDPVALRGDRWFLGKIYYYPEPGMHFGVPIANYVGWAVVGLLSFGLYQWLDRRLPDTPPPTQNVARRLLFGCALYYGILGFNLAVTFWIGELLIGATGLLLYLPITAFLLLKLAGRLRAPSAT